MEAKLAQKSNPNDYRAATADSQKLTKEQHERFAQTPEDKALQNSIGSKYDPSDRQGVNLNLNNPNGWASEGLAY